MPFLLPHQKHQSAEGTQHLYEEYSNEYITKFQSAEGTQHLYEEYSNEYITKFLLC